MGRKTEEKERNGERAYIQVPSYDLQGSYGGLIFSYQSNKVISFIILTYFPLLSYAAFAPNGLYKASSSSSFWNTLFSLGDLKDIDMLERVQRRATKYYY